MVPSDWSIRTRSGIAPRGVRSPERLAVQCAPNNSDVKS